MPAERVHLVPLRDEHLDATWRWLAESDVLRQQVDCRDRPTRDGNFTLWQARRSDSTRQDFAILAENNEHIGNCGLFHIDPFHRKAELWIYLGGGYGRGRGSEAMKLLMARAFHDVRTNRLYLRVVSDNPRAADFYRHLGFVEEGRLRQDSRRGDTYVDSICFSMLAPEYEARAKAWEATAP
jgi:RimJ/RimL family protein N-acetyltransferase